jgi:tRNA modification GTPase
MTIYALATPVGRSALAVIRLSGTRAGDALKALTRKPLPTAREARVRPVFCPETGRELDQALVLWMPAPHSFTGEDCVEVHAHGGLAVVESILTALASIKGLRPAEAGEFTRRAVVNGRLDLTAAEAIGDLIDAETSAQQQQALRQMRGALGALYNGWRDRIKTALAHLEADIEFADEDLPGGLGQDALAGLDGLAEEIADHLADQRGERLRDGVSVAIIGSPNAGKSSIINILAKKDAAIVSPQAGTTRDVVEVSLVMAGVPVTIADTAGLRLSGDDIEMQGVVRAKRRAEEADIRLLVIAPDAPPGDAVDLLLAGDFCLGNKADLGPTKLKLPDGVRSVALSALTGQGVDAFQTILTETLGQRFGLAEQPALTRARHRAALEEALSYLQRADAARHRALELAAEDLRLASRALGRITGRVDIEALLDIVFADFCIGK